MSEHDVYGMGNALVDSEYQVSDGFLAEQDIAKGRMTLIDGDEKERLVRVLDARGKPLKHSSGGSAGNSMAAVAQFGGRAFYSGKVGRDRLGELYLADMKQTGVTTSRKAASDDGPTGQCLVMVTPDAERTLNSFLGVTETLSEEQLEAAALKRSRFLYIEGYLMSSESGFRAARWAQDMAKAAGVRVVLTLSDPTMATHFQAHFAELMQESVDLLFCNAEESMLITGTGQINSAASALRERVGSFAVTLGAGGALVWDGERQSSVAAPACEPVDTNGAGDMFAGAFLHALNLGESYASAAQFANLAAARLVCSYGPRLTADEHRHILAQSHLT